MNKWLDDIEKAQKGAVLSQTKKSYNPNLAKDDKAFQSWYRKNTLEGQGKIPYSDKQNYDYYSFYKNGDYKDSSFNTENHFPDTYKRPTHETFSDESIYSIPENPGGHWKGETFVPAGVKTFLQDGGKFLGTTNNGFNYNGAWGGPAQNGASMPGAVGFSYARTGAPSNGKYAKKTMPSAQGGKKVDPNEFFKPNTAATDVLGLTEALKNKYPTDTGFATVERSPLMGGTKRFINVKQKLQLPSTPDPEYVDARKGYSDWYNDPYTQRTFQQNTGYDPEILRGLTTAGLNAPAEVATGNFLKSLDQDNAKAAYYDGINKIAYKKGVGKGTVEHEIAHASGVDSVLGPALMKALGGNPYQQKQNKTAGKGYMKEDISSIKQYLTKPEEAYGNFHNFRVDLGLKPGEKVDKATLLKKVKEKKLEDSNFYQMFDDENIVKAINTIAYNNKKDTSSYAKSGMIIEDEMGQWAHPGKITRIPSNHITMQGVGYPVLGVSDTGDKKLMKPGKDYKFKGSKVTEYPMIAKDGSSLKELDQLTNFTNYNKPQPGGWLDNL